MWKFKRETIRSSSCGSKELQYWHIDLPFTMHIHPCIHAHDHIFHSLKRHDSSCDLESGEKAAIPVMMAARAPSNIAISCSCQNPCHLRQFNFPPAKNQWGPRRSRQAKVVLKPFLYDATSYHASPNLPCLKAWNSWNYGCQIRAPGSQTKLDWKWWRQPEQEHTEVKANWNLERPYRLYRHTTMSYLIFQCSNNSNRHV